MSYRIDYEGSSETFDSEKNNSLFRIVMTLTVFVLFLFVVQNHFPLYRTSLLELIVPGDAVVTQKALDAMVVNLKNGLPFSEAAATFCVEIFKNAGIR